MLPWFSPHDAVELVDRLVEVVRVRLLEVKRTCWACDGGLSLPLMFIPLHMADQAACGVFRAAISTNQGTGRAFCCIVKRFSLSR